MTEIVTDDITIGKIKGTGVFDEIMTTIQVRLDEQFSKQRIKGSEYSKVYLGAMEAAMSQSIQFLLGRQQADKQAELLEQQVLKAVKEVELMDKTIEKADSEICILAQQCINEEKKGRILEQELLNLGQDFVIKKAQFLAENAKSMVAQAQILDELIYLNEDGTVNENHVAAQGITKEEVKIKKAQFLLTNAQAMSEQYKVSDTAFYLEENGSVVSHAERAPLGGEALRNKSLQVERVNTEIANATLASAKALTEQAQTLDTIFYVKRKTEVDEADVVASDSLKGILKEERDRKAAEVETAEAQTNKTNMEEFLLHAKAINEQANASDIVAINPRFDDTLSSINEYGTSGLIGKQKAKLDAERLLLEQKKVTEYAQTGAVSPSNTVSSDSVIGKQKLLYSAQTAGFSRDAEQKASKIMLDAWGTAYATNEIIAPPFSKDTIDTLLTKLYSGITGA